MRAFGLIPNALFFCAANVLRGLKMPFWPMVINMMRFVLLPWLFIEIFVVRLGYGLVSIWVTSVVAFVIAGVVMVWMAFYFIGRKERFSEADGYGRS